MAEDSDEEEKKEDQHHDDDDDGDLWTGPAAPMSASILANDPSCQGILALTLRDALALIQQEQQQVRMQPPPATETTTTTTTAIGTTRKDGNGNEEESRSRSRSEDDEVLTGDGSCHFAMDNVAIQSMLQAMGNAVVHTQQEHWKLQQHQQRQHELRQQQPTVPDPILASTSTTFSRNTAREDSNDKHSSSISSPPPSSSQPVVAAAVVAAAKAVQPPAALLRGRLDHYNRQNGKWRIVMDKVTFRRRMSLERVRRKHQRSSLWHVSRERFEPPSPLLSPTHPAAAAPNKTASEKRDTTRTAKGDSEKKTTSGAQPRGISLQILAYNDLE